MKLPNSSRILRIFHNCGFCPFSRYVNGYNQIIFSSFIYMGWGGGGGLFFWFYLFFLVYMGELFFWFQLFLFIWGSCSFSSFFWFKETSLNNVFILPSL
ncbi:hypothetical protein HanRHA438_Chr15g0719481 [Helianthus annuus]|nr:hypothetical protein HanRHA438_Chr15g0719481 [Helianthus annuus]